MPSEYTKKRKPLPKARKRIGEGHPGPFPGAVGPPMTKRYALPKPPPSRKAPRRLTPRPLKYLYKNLSAKRTASLAPPRSPVPPSRKAPALPRPPRKPILNRKLRPPELRPPTLPPSRKPPRRLIPRPPFTRTAPLAPPPQKPKPLRRKVNPRGQTRGK